MFIMNKSLKLYLCKDDANLLINITILNERICAKKTKRLSGSPLECACFGSLHNAMWLLFDGRHVSVETDVGKRVALG